MKLETWNASEEKARWKIVRTDSFVDVCPPGEIIMADEVTGECTVALTVSGNTENKTFNFGSGGIKIVRRRR